MPPGLSGSPPSFSRRAYYNRPSCNHQPSASLAFDIEGYGNSLIQYSPLPYSNPSPPISCGHVINAPMPLWLFSSLFSSFSSAAYRETLALFAASSQGGARCVVSGSRSLLMDWKRSREEIGGARASGGNRGCCDIGYWLFCRVENGWDWDSSGNSSECVLGGAMMRCVCVRVCVLFNFREEKKGFCRDSS